MPYTMTIERMHSVAGPGFTLCGKALIAVADVTLRDDKVTCAVCLADLKEINDATSDQYER